MARLKKTKCNPLSLPKDSFKVFSNIYNKSIKFEELREEYIQFSKLYSQFDDSMNTSFNYIHQNTVEGIESNDVSAQESDSSDEDIQINIKERNKKLINLGSLLHIFQVLHASGLGSIFPTLHLALKIACTLPVSSTTPERTFSKLKIVKNRLRSTISQERLEDLMMITCESDIPINNDDVTSLSYLLLVCYFC